MTSECTTPNLRDLAAKRGGSLDNGRNARTRRNALKQVGCVEAGWLLLSYRTKNCMQCRYSDLRLRSLFVRAVDKPRSRGTCPPAVLVPVVPPLLPTSGSTRTWRGSRRRTRCSACTRYGVGEVSRGMVTRSRSTSHKVCASELRHGGARPKS